jgi:hypothetical protein
MGSLSCSGEKKRPRPGFSSSTEKYVPEIAPLRVAQVICPGKRAQLIRRAGGDAEEPNELLGCLNRRYRPKQQRIRKAEDGGRRSNPNSETHEREAIQAAQSVPRRRHF